MSTKTLFIFALILIIVASYFYANNDSSLSKMTLKPSDIDYQAKNIQALQTNEQGLINYRLTATDVVHYQLAKMAILNQAKIEWRPSPERLVTFSATQATFDENAQLVTLEDNVIIHSQPTAESQTFVQSDNSLFNQQQPMTLTGKNFVGNLANKQLYTNNPITVTQGKHNLTAQRMNANLATGDYQFEQVAMVFIPNN